MSALRSSGLLLALAFSIAACTPAADEGAADLAGTPASEAATGTAVEGSSGTAVSGDATTPAAEGPAAGAGEMLAAIKARGALICGVNDQLPGFGFVTPEGDFEGFDVDFCRAIAAAVLGDPEAVTFRPLTTQERFTALQTGEVDVLVRNTTNTLSRDTQNGLDFAPTTFYDGQGVMVRQDLGVTDLAGLAGASICVQSGTTTEKNIGDAMRKIDAEFTPVVFEDPDQTFTAYDEGRCDAVTSDKSQLVSRQQALPEPEAHVILDATLSKEPLGPAVLQGDPQWTDIVRWVVYGVITAEELGITSQNIGEFAASEDPEIRRFLGLEEALGEGLGLGNDFMVTVITAVGNYGEIYDRNLGPDALDLARGPNVLWTEGGLLYAPPFR
jgi:general L-amino acid transport system substrate-binding protein